MKKVFPTARTLPILCLALAMSFGLSCIPSPVKASTPSYSTPDSLEVSASSAILLEQSTGTILYEKEAHLQLPPASVTKVMTILLVMEALTEGRVSKDEIIVVSANASAMGGSQVYLKEGETMTLWEMLKCVVVVSANDGSVALAEHLAGSEALFVEQMNQRATELGMYDTNFINCTGLPADNHYTTAYDIAIMSRELLSSHPEITELSTIWMDSIRNGSFGLSNTNRLIYSYTGATGLKTGSTEEAMYCISASASGDGCDYIAVILQAPSSSERFDDASRLLDYGFTNFTLQEVYPNAPIAPVPVVLGSKDYLQAVLKDSCKILIAKSQTDLIHSEVHLPDSLTAPIAEGQVLGSFQIFVDGQLWESHEIYASETVEKLKILDIFNKLFQISVMS